MTGAIDDLKPMAKGFVWQLTMDDKNGAKPDLLLTVENVYL
jgi:hypothetical protein